MVKICGFGHIIIGQNVWISEEEKISLEILLSAIFYDYAKLLYHCDNQKVR